MQYGYYDEKTREYVISRPVTPVPWGNVLGTPEYTAVITHNAGGGSFRKSMKTGRILRSGRTPFDAPGRFIYIRDNKSLDYWSASWQPVGKDLRKYISECRHGLGYTTMRAEYDDIRSDVLYYVPRDKEYEVWYVNISNRSDRIRHLTVTGFAEFTNDPDTAREAEAGSGAPYLSRTHFHDNRVVQTLGENADEAYVSRFLGLAGAEVSSYCGDLSAFLGLYRGYGNPLGVERGDLKGKLNYNGNSCGALSSVVVLKPGASVDMAFVAGEKNDEEAGEILREYQTPQAVCRQEWLVIKTWWEEQLARLQVQTPDMDFNQMVNTWDPAGSRVSFLWDPVSGLSETARMAEILPGYAAINPEQTEKKLKSLLSAQKMEGGCGTFRLLPAVYRYLCETGNWAFLDEHLPFSDAWDADVYEHLKRAVELPERRFGPHGLLFAAGSGELLPDGAESVLSTMQLWAAVSLLVPLARKREDADTLSWLMERRTQLKEALEQAAWREDRYIYGILADGQEIGCSQSLEATLWLLPQAFAICCGLADKDRARILRERIEEELDSPFGTRRMAPPFRHSLFPGMETFRMNAFVNENGAVVTAEQALRILMEVREGRGDAAYVLWKQAAPAAGNDTAEIRRQETYCYGTTVESPGSPHAGYSHGAWFSTAAPAVAAAAAEGILGIRPGLSELVISPALPCQWEEVTIDRILRGKKLHVVIKNPEHVQSGVVRLFLNEEVMEGKRIPYEALKEENEIRVEMGEVPAGQAEQEIFPEITTPDDLQKDGAAAVSPDTEEADTDTKKSDTENTDTGNTDSEETDPGETDPEETDPGETDPEETDPGETDSGETGGPAQQTSSEGSLSEGTVSEAD